MRPGKFFLALILALPAPGLNAGDSQAERIRAKARAESQKVTSRRFYLKLTELDRAVLKLTAQNKISAFGAWYGSGFTYMVSRDYAQGRAHEVITFYLDLEEPKPVLRLDKGDMAFVTMHQLENRLVAVWQAAGHFNLDVFGLGAATGRLERLMEKNSWSLPEMAGGKLLIRESAAKPDDVSEIKF